MFWVDGGVAVAHHMRPMPARAAEAFGVTAIGMAELRRCASSRRDGELQSPQQRQTSAMAG